MPYLKKIALPSKDGKVEEIYIGSLELKILQAIQNGKDDVPKIAEALEYKYYRNKIYDTVIYLKVKGLVKEGELFELMLTKKGIFVLKKLSKMSE